MTRVRWATPEDIHAYYGEVEKPTMQAAVMEVDGKILGIGGLYYEGGKLIAFSDFEPEAAQYKRLHVQAARMVLALMRSKRRPIYAVRDETLSTAPGFLAYLGFEDQGEYYVWHS